MRYIKSIIITCLLVSLVIGSTLSFTPVSAVMLDSTYQTEPIRIENPGFTVRIHPHVPLYAGDQVSFEISSPENTTLFEEQVTSVQARIGDPPGSIFGPVEFARDDQKKQLRATLKWVWNTSGLEPGSYTVTFSTEPVEVIWSQDVVLLDPVNMPDVEKAARWTSVQSGCCNLYVITGTAAYRDLSLLSQMVDEEAVFVASQLATELQDEATITFLPRVLGHGGFAAEQLYISYLDRNYAGGGARQVIKHEIVHMIDKQLGGEFRPSLFVEGLAVYISGGHFKPEPISPRARTLLDLNWYLPLQELSNNFYDSQHEIGYLEGAALIEYMVLTWGNEAFSTFYRDIKTPQEGETQSDVINTALLNHLGLSFEQLEQHFLEYLNAIPLEESLRDDMRLTVLFYDTVRRYQKALDPSAYFRQVWLPDGNEIRDRGIVADYLRHPNGVENRTLEILLVAADQELRLGNYTQVEAYLLQVNESLDSYQKVGPLIWVFHPTRASLLSQLYQNPILMR